LDQVFHRPGWVPAPADEFQAEVDRIAAGPEWIIDGNYTGRVASRYDAADTLIYLDVPTWLSMIRIVRRLATSYGQVRPDSAPGCPERLDVAFLRFAWSWNRIRRAKNLVLAREFSGRTIILRGPRQQRRFCMEQSSGTKSRLCRDP
jgi:adenylate kinase family enzyme